MEDFINIILECGLSDIGYSGSNTWPNNNISNFPLYVVEHLSRTMSNHTVLLLNIKEKFEQTQMAGKLILSLDRNLTIEDTIYGGSIQFRVEFQKLKLSINGERWVDLSARMQKDSPIVEITLRQGVDSPISKIEATVTPLPIVPSVESSQRVSIPFPSSPARLDHLFKQTPAKPLHAPLEVIPPVVLRSRRLKRSCSSPPPPALREKNPSVGAFSKNNGGIDISHLCFIDDIIIFCNGSIQCVKKVKKFLTSFERVSGLKFNNSKFSFIGGKGMSSMHYNNIKLYKFLSSGSPYLLPRDSFA
ncbi:hypothetical protein M5K25_004114 [Dendrobium thyrsiflorum]|uniref:Reverse transcriptase domain-containing protein n=1 Tax=Dendrobium thyrsiflorum TaxID=117978 RepID=A0ABD0VKZ1_DENTH